MIQAAYICKTQDPEIIKTYGEADRSAFSLLSFDNYKPLTPLIQLNNYCYDEKFEITYLFVEELTMHGNHYEKGDICTKAQLLNHRWLEEEIGYMIVERRVLKDISISSNKFLLSGFDDGGSGLFNDVIIQRNDNSTPSVSYNNKKITITGYFNNVPQNYIKNLKKEMKDAIDCSQHVIVCVDNSPVDYRYMSKDITPIYMYYGNSQTDYSSSSDNSRGAQKRQSLPLYTFGIIDSFSIESGEFTKFTVVITTNIPHFILGISFDDIHSMSGNIISDVMEPSFNWTFDSNPTYKRLYISLFVYMNLYSFYSGAIGPPIFYALDDRINPWIPENSIASDPYPWSRRFNSEVCESFCKKDPQSLAPYFYLI